MLPLITIVQTPENSLQSILGCFPAHQVNRSSPIWTIPGVNPRSAYAKTRYNALQGVLSSPTISIHHLTPQNVLQVNSGGLNGISASWNHGIATPSPKFLIMRIQYQYQLDNENSLSIQKVSTESRGRARGRAGGRGRTCRRIKKLLKNFQKIVHGPPPTRGVLF